MSDGTVTTEKLRPMPKPKRKPVLTDDGRGLKYEEVRALLAEKHDSGLSLDDPILMLVTILNVYLSELEKAHLAYNTALGDILAAKTGEHIAKVKEAASLLEKAVSESSVNAVNAAFTAHDTSLRRHTGCMLWLYGVMVLAAFGVILKGFLY